MKIGIIYCSICVLYVEIRLTMMLTKKKKSLSLEKSALIYPFEICLNLFNKRNKLKLHNNGFQIKIYSVI